MTADQPHNVEFRNLIAAVRAGDERAIRILHDDYYRHVIAVVRRSLMEAIRSKFDSQDFAQVVWFALFSEPGKLDGIERPSQLRALLTTIARNKVNDENRRRTRTQKNSVFMETSMTTEVGQELPITGSGPTPSQCAIAHETMALCEAKLSLEHQRVLKLKIDGLTNNAIADELGIHERTVRRVLERVEQGIR